MDSLPNDDPEQYNFRDDRQDIDITLSAMGLNAQPDDVQTVASKMIEFRLDAEGRVAGEVGRHLTIAEPINVSRPWGHAIAYYGSDDTGRQFSYSGMITRRTVINLYMSSTKLSEAELMRVMNDVGSKIEFDRTPLHAADKAN